MKVDAVSFFDDVVVLFHLSPQSSVWPWLGDWAFFDLVAALLSFCETACASEGKMIQQSFNIKAVDSDQAYSHV